MNRPFLSRDRHWSPSRWRTRDAHQLPSYEEPAVLEAVERRLSDAAPVVRTEEIDALRDSLAAVCRGEAFLLQGGDCAENFDDAIASRVAALARLFDAMAVGIETATGRDVLRLARIGGQFAKPRSDATETRGRVTLPAYRGDIVNAQGFSAAERRHDPARMIQAHVQSVGTAATLRAARHHLPPIYTSHEGLLLHYEQALTRQASDGAWWATSGHLLWLGDRTRQLDGAHVDYLSGIANPVGVKCGPSMTGAELGALCDRLDPADTPGKLVMIVRMGADAVEERLPPLLCAVGDRKLVWIVDPMHGNTVKQGGRKVRHYDSIRAETRAFMAILHDAGMTPGGVHLEMSPDPVTECIGGGGPETLEALDRAYRTACDPRLNGEQALRLIADMEGHW